MERIPPQDTSRRLAEKPGLARPVAPESRRPPRGGEVETGRVLQGLCRAVASGLSTPVAFILIARGRRRAIRAGVGMPHLTRIPFVVDARDRLAAAIAEDGTVDMRDLEADRRGLDPDSTLDPDGSWRAVIVETIPLGGDKGALVAADVRPREWSAEDRALLATLAVAVTGSLRSSAAASPDGGSR